MRCFLSIFPSLLSNTYCFSIFFLLTILSSLKKKKKINYIYAEKSVYLGPSKPCAIVP